MAQAFRNAADAPSVAPRMSDDRSLNSALKRNIDALRRRRIVKEERAALDEKLARAIPRFAGSVRFVYFHACTKLVELVELVSMVAERTEVPQSEQHEIDEMKQRVAPEAVLDAIDQPETESR
jgi:hypothetical protein